MISIFIMVSLAAYAIGRFHGEKTTKEQIRLALKGRIGQRPWMEMTEKIRDKLKVAGGFEGFQVTYNQDGANALHDLILVMAETLDEAYARHLVGSPSGEIGKAK